MKRGDEMQTFSMGTALYTGENALGQLSRLCGEKNLLVTDPYFTKSGLAEKLAGLCGGQVRIFDRVAPDPSLALTAEGVALLQEFSPDTLLALGGGSAIDCAKGILSMGNSRARLIAIPTTSGTGSEITSFAILTHDGVKHPLVDPSLRPTAAILDPSLLDKLPPVLIADAGMDVAAHCLEAIGARGASAFSDAMAMSAFRTVLELLPKSFRGDNSVREDIHNAAAMAGIAFDNAGLGACHALSHALGGEFHLAHGRLNGILLPHVMQFNAQTHPAPYKKLTEFCGLMGLRGLLSAISRLRTALNLPATLREAGLPAHQIRGKAEALCKAAAADPCSAANPRPVTEADYMALLKAAI